MDLIKISLNGLSAVTVDEFDLPPETSIKKLKGEIEGSLQVPPFFQKLLLGPKVLCDSDTIAKYCPPDVKSLCLTWLLSVQAVHRIAFRDKIEALKALERLGSKAGEQATKLVVHCVGNPNSDDASVRFSAVRALAAVGKKGNKDAIDALCTALKDPDENVRQATVEALLHLVERGDKDALAKIASKLSEESGQARFAALMVLGDIVEESDEEVLAAMCARLDDLSCEVRMAAARALRRFIDCPHISSVVRDCLHDANETMLTVPGPSDDEMLDVEHHGILYAYSD